MTPTIANTIAASGEVYPMEPVFQERPRFAIPPSTDVKTLQAELDIALSMLVRERGVVKELAAALQGLMDEYDAASRSDNGPGWDAEAQAQMIAARAALSRVPQ